MAYTTVISIQYLHFDIHTARSCHPCPVLLSQRCLRPLCVSAFPCRSCAPSHACPHNPTPPSPSTHFAIALLITWHGACHVTKLEMRCSQFENSQIRHDPTPERACKLSGACVRARAHAWPLAQTPERASELSGTQTLNPEPGERACKHKLTSQAERRGEERSKCRQQPRMRVGLRSSVTNLVCAAFADASLPGAPAMPYDLRSDSL